MKKTLLFLGMIVSIIITLYSMHNNTDEVEETVPLSVERFRKVLVSEEQFYCTDARPYQNKNLIHEYSGYLNELAINDEPIITSQFAVIDLDGDEVDEIVLAIEDYGGFIVLRYRESGVVGAIIGYRSMRDIKEDGTFWQSGSAEESYISRLFFVDNIWIANDKIRKNHMSYYLHDIPTNEAEWEQMVNVYNDTKDVEWHDLTKREINQWVVDEFVSEEKARINNERQNYLDSLSYLIDYTYDYSIKSQNEINRDAKAYYDCCNNEMNRVYELCKNKFSGADLEELESGQSQWQEAIDRRMYTELYNLKKVHSIEELKDQRMYYTYGDVILRRIFYLLNIFFDSCFYN